MSHPRPGAFAAPTAIALCLAGLLGVARADDGVVTPEVAEARRGLAGAQRLLERGDSSSADELRGLLPALRRRNAALAPSAERAKLIEATNQLVLKSTFAEPGVTTPEKARDWLLDLAALPRHEQNALAAAHERVHFAFRFRPDLDGQDGATKLADLRDALARARESLLVLASYERLEPSFSTLREPYRAALVWLRVRKDLSGSGITRRLDVVGADVAEARRARHARERRLVREPLEPNGERATGVATAIAGDTKAPAKGPSVEPAAIEVVAAPAPTAAGATVTLTVRFRHDKPFLACLWIATADGFTPLHARDTRCDAGTKELTFAWPVPAGMSPARLRVRAEVRVGEDQCLVTSRDLSVTIK